MLHTIEQLQQAVADLQADNDAYDARQEYKRLVALGNQIAANYLRYYPRVIRDYSTNTISIRTGA